jgi:AsmA protein
MKKALKYGAIAIGILLVLLLAAAGIIAATFNPNDYKPLLIREVQAKTQRALVIPGDIKLAFFPKLGVDLGNASLSEPNSNTVFASVDRAKLSLALLPLLSKQLVVDQVRIDGLKLDIRRAKDGSTNFDDLLNKRGKKEEGGQAFRFDIDSVRIADAQLRFDDRKEDRTLILDRFKLDTGKLMDGVPGKLKFSGHVRADKPALDANVALDSGFAFDLERKQFAFDDIDADVKGNAASAAFDVKLKARADLGRHLVDVSKIDASVSLPNPAGDTIALKAGGSAGIDLAKNALTANLKGSLDDSHFEAKLGLPKFSPAVYTFDASIDKLDLDRYEAKPAATAASAPSSPATPTAAPVAAQKNAQAGKPSGFAALGALRELHADGSLRIGTLKVKNIQTANVRLGLHAAGGRVDFNPLALDLYGGHAEGTMTLTASEPLRIAMRQNLTGIDVGPLLKDATGKNTLEGKGNVQIDISTGGDDVARMKKALAGTARLALRDGAVRGVNIAQAVREAKTRIGEIRGDAPPQSGTASSAEKTDFSELGASFRIANGVAHNDDLAIKSPLLRIAGAGDINIGEDRLDYTVRATVVPTLEGQGGPELQALKGVTVPVKLEGPFASLAWHVDFAGMARGLAQQKLDEKKDELRTRAQQAIDEQKAKLGDQLKDQLKGLLGR